MQPLISVIIPVYNRADTIARAIHSILEQTFKELDVIVVDDGSTDQTIQVVQEIHDARVQLLQHPRNMGAAEARNTGMKAATGKYIALLDSDDEWLRDKLQMQLDAFVHAAPDQKACYTAFERIDQRFGTQIYFPRDPDLKKLFLACDVAPSTLLFERSVLDKIGYMDSSFIRYEDWDWILRYCKEYRFLPVEKPMVRKYYTPEGSSKDVEISATKFVSKYSNELREFGVYRNIVISRRWMEVARYYAQEHDLGKIVEYTVKGLAVYPFQPLEIWSWLINAWFGIKIGSFPSKVKAMITRSRGDRSGQKE
jgi:glycosyltransferase involved in cell wall biosynthesis